MPQSTYANGTHAVVLEVDPETGAVQILRWIVAHDCGHVLEPGIVDGQIHGGVVQGLPDALNVQLAYDDGGPAPDRDPHGLRARHRGRRAAELRASATSSRRRRSTRSGAKGAGEGGIMPVHPAHRPGHRGRAGALRRARIERVPVTRADIHAMVRAARGRFSPSPLRGEGRVRGLVARSVPTLTLPSPSQGEGEGEP